MKMSIPPLLLLESILLSSIVNLVSSDRILVATFMSSKSHKITYFGLLEELARRGHEITILSPVQPLKKVKGIREIFTLDGESLFFGDFNPVQMKERNEKVNPLAMVDKFVKLCSLTYDLPQVKSLMNETFDLIIVHPLTTTTSNDCVMGLVYRIKAPFVIFTPKSASGLVVSFTGGYHPPSFVPNAIMDYLDETSFIGRFLNFGITNLFEIVYWDVFIPKIERVMREKLGDDIPPLMEILGNASLILSNGHFILNGMKPNLPNVVDVGGIHSRPAENLTKDLEYFVSKSGDDGFILFSMGSIIKGEKQMSQKKIQIFLNVFSKLRQRVLWKWDSEFMANKTENIKLSKWLPQQDVLGHPNIKLFITHCGGGSVEEAIYHGVPLIGIPMFGDQLLNAKQAKRNGFLTELDWNELTEDTLTNAINEVLNNSRYRENVQRLSKIFKDQPDSPLQRGVYWIEYVLRHKGAPHLRCSGRRLNALQYHSLDVLAAYAAIFALLIYFTFFILRFLLRKIFESFRSMTKLSCANAECDKKIN